jgi:2-keto-4-pentenoate hydratase/2-oxohepta-3-ene-1,7-dioic acid hydratase in catechol pathway
VVPVRQMVYPRNTMIHGFTVQGSREQVPIGKIVALGRNYREHVREMGGTKETGDEAPVLFLKPPSALVTDGGHVVRPRYSLNLHHELELVIAIGRPGRYIAAEAARKHILGFAVGLDMTLRDVQTEAKRRGHPWAVAKGFDTSAPLSAVVSAAAVPDPDQLIVELKVNGELRQRGRAGDMILRVPEIVNFVSNVFTLEAGDLIFTGTPEGVGAVFPGDILDATLCGHVDLHVTIADEEPTSTRDNADERRGQATIPGGLPPSDARPAR